MTRVVTTVANLGELNQDDEERINIIGLAGDYSVGGQERFKGLEAYQPSEEATGALEDAGSGQKFRKEYWSRLISVELVTAS